MVLFLFKSSIYFFPKEIRRSSSNAVLGIGKPLRSEGFRSRKLDVMVYHHQNISLLMAAITGYVHFFSNNEKFVSRDEWPAIPLILNAGGKSVKTFQ